MSETANPFHGSNMKEAGIGVASVTGGLVAGFAATKAVANMTVVKSHPMLGSGAIVAIGAIGAVMSHKHNHTHWLLASLGFAAVGALQLMNHAVAPAPGGSSIVPMYGTEDMNGIIPESLKAKIRGFLPSFGSIEDEEIFRQMKGSDYEDLRGGYADLTGDEYMGALDVSHEDVSGFGDASNMI